MRVHVLALPKIRSLRRVRLWLALALVALGAVAAEHARADVIGPPSQHVIHLMTTLEGEDSRVSTPGAPDHVMFRVINPGRTRATLTIESLVLVGAEGNTRLAVASVRANNQPANPAAVSVQGHSTVHLMVFFTGLPPARANAGRFSIRLSARIDGTVQRADSTITRGGRSPLHR